MFRVGISTFGALSEAEIIGPVSDIADFDYSHIDTTSFHLNEEQVAKVLQGVFARIIKRGKLFIRTKLAGDDNGKADENFRDSMK
jgi:diketogulonate reductase-like aldo/keto reductase